MEANLGHRPSHPYRPLADVDEIRLLRLKPGSNNDAIKCSLEHANLLEKPSYEALSYMWGESTNEQPVEIDGITSQIRPNLRLALYHLRHATEDRVLWIDALCINQYDTNERNHQVAQMGRIYSHASWVVAWLGEPDAASRHALDFLRNFYRSAHEEVIRVTDPYRDNFTATVDQSAWISVPLLCFRKYWSRLWIMQEVVLASNIMVHCGPDTCRWNALVFYFRKLVQGKIIHKDMREAHQNFQVGSRHTKRIAHSRYGHCLPYPGIIYRLRDSTVNRLIRDRDTTQSSSPRSLLALALEYGEAECFDQRDRIFGLSSFAKPCCQEAVPVDYSLQIADLTKMLVSHHSQAHHLPGSEAQIRSHFERSQDDSEQYAKKADSDSWMSPPDADPAASSFMLKFDTYILPLGLALYLERSQIHLERPAQNPIDYLNSLTWKDTPPDQVDLTYQSDISAIALSAASGVQNAIKNSLIVDQSNDYLG